VKHCNKKFALKWHKVCIRLDDSFLVQRWSDFTSYYRKEIQRLPSAGRFRLPNGGACAYVENEEDAIMLTLMYS
jgi:hypothetical protein